jgi:hypothetical protein
LPVAGETVVLAHGISQHRIFSVKRQEVVWIKGTKLISCGYSMYIQDFIWN